MSTDRDDPVRVLGDEWDGEPDDVIARMAQELILAASVPFLVSPAMLPDTRQDRYALVPHRALVRLQAALDMRRRRHGR